MSNNQSLEKLYYKELKPKLSELNKNRKYILSQIKRYIAYSVIPVSISFYLSFYFENPIPVVIVVSISIIFSFYKIKPIWNEYYNNIMCHANIQKTIYAFDELN